MKGQVVIEFIIAALIFFSIILYSLVTLNTAVSTYREDFFSNKMQSKVIQISEVMMHSESAGISDGYPVIDSNLLQGLADECSINYPRLLHRLDLINRRVKIQVNESSTGAVLLDCGPGVPAGTPKVSVSRFGIMDTTGDTVKIGIWVW